MYDKQFLLNALDAVIASAANRLNENEWMLLQQIRNHIADSNNDEETEKYYFELVNWFILLLEFLKNTS